MANEEVDPYFKFASPSYMSELDWAITFSKYDFPWHEIRFGRFSAKECYKKYTGLVRDAQTFFKKILGGRPKHKKYIAGQLDEAQRVFFGSLPEDTAASQAPSNPLFGNENQNEPGNESDNIELFCVCRGEFQSQTGYFVMCENEDKCKNGGWLHPECTRDLCNMTQDEIMLLDKWYCQDCVDARNPSPKKSDSKQARSNRNSAAKKKGTPEPR